MIPILILAAGQSKRMRGADKMLEDAAGQPLLRRQVMMAADTGQPVFVALPKGDAGRRAAIAGFDMTIIRCADAAEGLSGSLRNSVAQLPDAPAFMVLLADLVALETSDLRKVIAARDADPDALIWRGATADGTNLPCRNMEQAMRADATLVACPHLLMSRRLLPSSAAPWLQWVALQGAWETVL